MLLPSSHLLFPLRTSSLSHYLCRRSIFRLSAFSRRGTERSKGSAFFTHKRTKTDGGGAFTAAEDKIRKEEMNDEDKGMKGEFLFNEGRAKGNDKGLRGRSMELKARKANPVSTICYVQILGTGMDTQDTSPSILLFFDKQRFLFNAGEGLQRFCSEHKIKLSKIDHIFLSRVCSETAGGIPGLLLTLAGLGDEGMSVNIWGPSDLEFLLGAMRGFIPKKAMLHAHSFSQSDSATSPSPNPTPTILIDNEVVRISAIFINPKPDKELLNVKAGETAVVYVCELPEVKGKFDLEKAKSLGLKPGPKYRHLQLGQSVKSDSLDITVNPSDVLGPPTPGPIILLIDCPTVAHSTELFTLPSLDRYTKGHTDESHTEGSGRVVNCVIHLGPAGVTECAAYRNWMGKFGGAQHIMAGHARKSMEFPILQASARISSRLNYLCPQFFPTSGFWPSNYENNINMDQNMDSYEIISASNLLKFNLRPISSLGLDKSAVPITLSHNNIIRELFAEMPEIKEISQQISKLWQNDPKPFLPSTEKVLNTSINPYLNKCNSLSNNSNSKLMEKRGLDINENSSPPLEGGLKKRLRDNLETPIIPSCLEKITREEMEITLLGTGSSQPSKYRNVTSIYIDLFNNGSILLDCGEGSLGQLKRRFGVEGADEAVKKLKLIWVSHIHADHHTGLVRILALRYQLLKLIPHEPLLVIGPSPLQRFLTAYADLEELDFHFIDCRQTLKSSKEALNATGAVSNLFGQGSKMESIKRKPLNSSNSLDKLKEVLLDAGLEDLYSVPVRHCAEAFGLVLQSRDRVSRIGKWIPGWKLVYSGDTRPCPALIEAAKDATVLIHEATFEDSMTEEAIAKNHSTTKEAIQVGNAAGVYRVILTHFSQRYPKIPVLDEVDTEKTCIAFDLMSVNLADLPVLPKVLPYLKCLFKDEMVIDELDEDEVREESVVY